MISTMNNNTTAACGSTLDERVAALEADGAVLQALHERVAALEAALQAGKGKAVPKAKAKAEKVKVSLSPSDDMGRLSADDINAELCQARRLPEDTIPGYAPKVYREEQCKKTKKEGDLCTSCNKAFEKAEELGEEFQCHKAGHPKWFGLITEDPHPTCHMLGTAWAEKKVSKVDEAAEDSASDSGSSEKMTKAAAKAEAKAAAKAEKEAAKAEKAAAKAAEKAAKEAAKAEKPKATKSKDKAKAAEPEPESEVASEAESEAEETPAPKPKAEKVKAEPKPKATKEKAAPKEKAKAEKPKAAPKAKGKKADVMPAKAAEEEVKTAYEILCYDDELLAKKANGDCYETDEATHSVPTTYYGHMTEDGVVDKTIPEQTEAESDSD